MAGIILNRNRQVPAEETPAFGGIAERFRRAGDLDRAIALCRDGLKRFPDQLSARVTLGWSLLDKGQYDAARAELEQVLRRAPDNLAAIRGLAELHDRSEGAISSDAEQESWRNAAAASDAADAAAEAAAAAVAPVDMANLAPIQVALRTTEELASPEILHTGADTEFATDNITSALNAPVADLIASPVELEDAAAASMAAAEPAPFFVVDPSEALLETAADASVDVEAFDAGNVDLISQAEAAALAMEIDVDLQPAGAAFSDAAGIQDDAEWDEAGDLAAQVMDSATVNAGIEPTPVAALEALDDVDEEAGLELADAIKALEEATRRVEAKLAVPPVSIEPAAGAEEINAFEFLDATGEPVSEEPEFEAPILPVIDASHDGAFELIAPDLASVELEPEVATDIDNADTAAGEPVDAFPTSLLFDVTTQSAELEDASSVPVLVAIASAEDNIDIEALASLTDDEMVAEETGGGEAESLEFAEVPEAVETAEEAASVIEPHAGQTTLAGVAAHRGPEALESPGADVAPDIDAVSSLVESESEVGANLEFAADAESAAETEIRGESDVVVAQAEIDAEIEAEIELAADRGIDTNADSEVEAAASVQSGGDAQADEDYDVVASHDATRDAGEATDLGEFEAQIAALVAIDPVGAHAPVVADDTFADASAYRDEDRIEADLSAIFAGVSTDVVAPAVTALVDAVAEPEIVSPAITRSRKTLAALERFLRQVQARQLELRSETVA